jgi:hypothetical protein
MINMTPSEKAYIESGGAVHPDTGKPAEADAQQEMKDAETTATEQTEQPDANADGEGDKETEAPETEESDDDSEEIVDVANQDGETRRKMIAFGAYDKQRKAAKAAKEQLTQMQQQMAYLQGMLQNVQQPGAKASQTADGPQQPQITDTPPDHVKEPEKWLAWVNQTLAHSAKTVQQQTAQSQQSQQFAQLNDAVLAAEQEFVETQPDFYDALKYVQGQRKAELKELGYGAAEIQQIMAAQAQDVALRALNQGKNPAERIYALAKARGYKAAPPPKTETEAQKVIRQAEGQKKATTIANLSGGGPKGITVETLANTSQEEFNKMWAKGEAQKILGIPM